MAQTDDGKKSAKDALEEELKRALTAGEMERVEPEQGARALLGTRYEIRVQAAYDPVREETRIIRRIAREPDGKYDAWADGSDEEEKK